MLRHLSACAAALALASFANAQTPAIPGIPGVPGTAVPATTAAGTAVPAAAAAPPSNIWSMLCMTPEQKAQCKQHLCNIPLVPLLGNVLSPIKAVSGGLVPNFCPGPNDPTANGLNQPADSAVGAADRIKQKEAQAKARRAAVRYLGTVDCRRYPEAEAALINSLLGDENECVRYEAALAFANGCCCTKKVLKALTQVVSCRKGNEPPETSRRVRYVAGIALDRCLCRYAEVDEVAPPEKPAGEAEKKEEKKAALAPAADVEDARRVLAWHKSRLQAEAAGVKPGATASATPANSTPEPKLLPEAQPIPVSAEPKDVRPTTVQLMNMQEPPPAKAITPAMPNTRAAMRAMPGSGSRDLLSVLRWSSAK